MESWRPGLDLVGLDNHESRIHLSGLVRRHGKRRLTPGEAGRDPLGQSLFPLGLRPLGIVARRDVAGLFPHVIGRGRTEQGEFGLGRVVQDGAGPLALGVDQLLAFLMHDLEDRAAPQQVLITGVLADIGAALPRGVLAHLITDRVAQVLGDGQLMGRVPGGRRRDLHRVIAVVTDSGPWDGDFPEGGLEGEGSCPAALDAVAAFAVPPLEDEFLVRFLDEDPEELSLDFETDLMDARLDLVGEMLVLVGHGHGHLQLEFE